MSETAGPEPNSLASAGAEKSVAGPAAATADTQDSQARLAFNDIVAGACAWRLWGLLGWLDIRQRYRRSKIGPFWITISMGAMIAGMGLFYPRLFHTSAPAYLPFITIGFVTWGLISGTINDNCMAFIAAESVIKQIRLPLSLYVFRAVWRNLILFAHNLVVYVLVALFFRIWPGISIFLLIPGLLLVSTIGVSLGLVLGTVCARFRDIPQIVASVLQIFFFLTPIFWRPEALAGRSLLIDLNPFYAFIELIRGPLLGEPPAVMTWLATLTMALCSWAIAFLLYSRLRRRIAYWL